MSTSNFYLKNASASKKTAIIISINYNGKRLKFSTGKSIHPDLWKKDKQRAKTKGHPENADLNDELDKISRAMNFTFNEFIRNEIDPSIKKLKDAFYVRFYKGKKAPLKAKSFWEHFDEFVEYKKTRVCNDVYKDYNNSLRKHLKKVEGQFNRKIKFEDMYDKPGGFIEKFEFYLNYKAINSRGEEGLMINTIGKQFKNLKSFLNYCFDKQIIAPFSLKHMVSKSEDTYKVFLSEEELMKIIDLDILDERLACSRDLFIVACRTGLRYGDLVLLKPIHVQNDKIRIDMSKTGKRVLVPINSDVRKILARYNNDIPKPKNSVEFNDDIRKVVEMAKINYYVEVIYTNEGKKKSEIKKKYELVSSHTGRRSFCTNLFLAGMPAEAVMVFSGHKSVRAFMRYLKIDSELAAKKYKDEFFK